MMSLDLSFQARRFAHEILFDGNAAVLMRREQHRVVKPEKADLRRRHMQVQRLRRLRYDLDSGYSLQTAQQRILTDYIAAKKIQINRKPVSQLQG